MKKRLLFHLLLLLFPVFILPINASASSNEHVNPTTNNMGCPAPPPGWLIATDVAPDHISLLWESGQVSMYYKITTYDNTGGYYESDQYTSNNSITINNLTPTHCYTFTVYATYCPEAPEFEDGISGDWCLPSIIIDEIVEVQSPCTLNNGQQTNPGQEYFVCAGLSPTEKNEPYLNAFIGKVDDGNDRILDFAIAYDGMDAHVGETVISQPYFFDYPSNDPTTADCYIYKQGGVDTVFRIHSLNTTYVDVALFNIKFFGTYTFSYCFTCQLPGGIYRITPLNDAASQSPVQISPNPFSESTAFRYALSEPGPVEIGLYDAMGRLVKVVEKTAQRAAGDYETIVDGAELPDGVYFLHTMTGHDRKVFALVKRE